MKPFLYYSRILFIAVFLINLSPVNVLANEIDLADYFDSSVLPEGFGIALLEDKIPHKIEKETLSDGSEVVYVGKNFGDDTDNYDILTITENSIEIHYEVGETSDYIRRFTDRNDNNGQYTSEPTDSQGALWIPRFPVLGQPYEANHTIDYYQVDGQNDFYRAPVGSGSSDQTRLVTWAEKIDVPLTISEVNYETDHLIRVSQQWHPCTIEQYEYAKGVGLVNWRTLEKKSCFDSTPGSISRPYGSYSDLEMQTDGALVDTGTGETLAVVSSKDFFGSGEEVSFVLTRPDFSNPVYNELIPIDTDWDFSPEFLNTNVDELPPTYNFNPISFLIPTAEASETEQPDDDTAEFEDETDQSTNLTEQSTENDDLENQTADDRDSLANPEVDPDDSDVSNSGLTAEESDSNADPDSESGPDKAVCNFYPCENYEGSDTSLNVNRVENFLENGGDIEAIEVDRLSLVEEAVFNNTFPDFNNPSDTQESNEAQSIIELAENRETELDNLVEQDSGSDDDNSSFTDDLMESVQAGLDSDNQVGEGGDEDNDPEGLITCTGTDCDLCDFVSLVDVIVNWLIGVMMVIFAIIVAFAGVRLVTSGGNPEAKTAAKKMVTNTIIGLLIVLSAWILIDTLMRALLPGGEGTFSDGTPWSTVKCSPQTPVGGV